jgi:O-antigen biosynthesis protein WbqP
MIGYLKLKRLIDIVLSLIFLIIFFPIVLVIAILIKLETPGPILFKQRRVGKNLKVFVLYKFRTMKQHAPSDVPTHLLLNTYFLTTKVGLFLRKSSLDELPQIFNILKGEMSIVGPRPALWNQYDLIQERDNYDVNVLTPGLTGWAQINGRDELTTREKAEFDGEYVRKMGLTLDMKIIFLTIIKVVKMEGIREGGV